MATQILPYKTGALVTSDSNSLRASDNNALSKDLALDAKKSHEIYQQKSLYFQKLKWGGPFLAGEMVAKVQDKQLNAIESAVRLVNEYHELKNSEQNSGLLGALSNLFFGGAKKVSEMDLDARQTFASTDFRKNMHRLPNFWQIWQQFPDVEAKFEEIAKPEAEGIKASVITFTDASIDSILKKEKPFCDAITKELLTAGEEGAPLSPVHLIPTDKENDPVSLRKAHELLGNNMWHNAIVKHPTLEGRQLKRFVPAYDTELAIQKKRCGLIDDMRTALVNRDPEFFNQTLQRYSEFLSTTSDYTADEIEENARSLKDLFTCILGEDDVSKALYDSIVWLFDAIYKDKAANGREIFRKYLKKAALTNEKSVLKHIGTIIDTVHPTKAAEMLEAAQKKIAQIEAKREDVIREYRLFCDPTLKEEIMGFIDLTPNRQLSLENRVQQLLLT